MLARHLAIWPVAELAGNEQLVAAAREGNVIAGRDNGWRQDKTGRLQALFDSIHSW
jgi:hypothetical protein